MNIIIIGANGFVGSALSKYFIGENQNVTLITRDNFGEFKGHYDITIDASGSSRKFVAEQNSTIDLQHSLVNAAKVIDYYTSDLHIYLSSVDIYKDLGDPKFTFEDDLNNIPANTNYGFNKYLTELYLRKHLTRFLIFRLSGMVGDGLKKNPIYDLIHKKPIWISPYSRFQFIQTSTVARIIHEIINKKLVNETFNIAGRGVISFFDFCEKYNLDIVHPTDRDLMTITPRIVDVSIDKISSVVDIPSSEYEIDQFMSLIN